METRSKHFSIDFCVRFEKDKFDFERRGCISDGRETLINVKNN